MPTQQRRWKERQKEGRKKEGGRSCPEATEEKEWMCPRGCSFTPPWPLKRRLRGSRPKILPRPDLGGEQPIGQKWWSVNRLISHLCVEPQADTHLPHLTAITLGGVQVAAEARQRHRGPAVGQKHVSWSCCDDSVRHWACTHTHTQKWNGSSGAGEAGPQSVW